jgi:uncharacterized lipoprotein YmbA
MNKRLKHVGLASAFAIGVIGLNGCASSTVNYYSLPMAEAEKTATYSTDQGPLIYLRAVRIPALLQRPEVVTKRNRDANVKVHSNALWAGDIQSEITRRFATSLEAAQPGSIVFSAPVTPDHEPDVYYTIDLQRLDGELGEQATIELQWTAKYSGEVTTTEQGRYKASEAINGNGIDNYLTALSRLIERAASSIAEQAEFRTR